MNEREKFFFLSFFIFFLIILLSFPAFSMLQFWLSFFLLFNPIQDFSFIAPSFIKLFLSFYHVFLICYSLISFFFYYCLCLVYLILSVIDLRKLFSFIHLKFRSVVISVLFSYFPLLILRFPVLKVAISFVFIPFFLKHVTILIETCMTKEWSEMLILMNHPFARPLLHRAIYVVRTDRNPLFRATWFWHWNFIVLARPCVGITAQFRCQMKDNELNSVTMKIIYFV